MIFGIMAMKVMLPKCVNYKKCGRQAKGPYARFCWRCFVSNARLKGSVSFGNSSGNPGNAGNSSASGNLRNAGNVMMGKAKKDAGKRSGLRRSARKALVVKKKWLDLIFAGEKTWEIRGCLTFKRGWVHFAESQAGGKLRGRARLVNCFPVLTESFQRHYKKHCVPSLTMVPYVTPYAWVLEDAEEFEKPFEYEHKQGAVIWVDV